MDFSTWMRSFASQKGITRPDLGLLEHDFCQPDPVVPVAFKELLSAVMHSPLQSSGVAVVPSQQHIAETDIAVSGLRVVLQSFRPQRAVSTNRATGKQFLINSIRLHIGNWVYCTERSACLANGH